MCAQNYWTVGLCFALVVLGVVFAELHFIRLLRAERRRLKAEIKDKYGFDLDVPARVVVAQTRSLETLPVDWRAHRLEIPQVKN